MKVIYTNSWASIDLEKEAAESLIADGCVLISQHADTTGASTACEKAGVPIVGYNVSMIATAPTQALTSASIDWGPYYTYAVKSVIDGTKIDTDWCKGYDDGADKITELNDKAIAKGTKEKVKDILLKDKDVNGIVQICSFVIAEKDIDKYTNESFAADYRGWKFNIEKGCILAIGNQYNVRINKIRDDLANTSSIFSIVPNADQTENNLLVDLGQQKIVISLPEKTYQQYYNIQGYIDIQPAMHSMIIVPALVYVFSELRSTENLEEMEYYRWYRSLKKACNGIGINIDEEGLKKMDLFKVAQQLLNSPISKAIEYSAMGGGIYED